MTAQSGESHKAIFLGSQLEFEFVLLHIRNYDLLMAKKSFKEIIIIQAKNENAGRLALSRND